MNQRLATLSFQIDAAGKAVRLLPAGSFRSADGSGRPSVHCSLAAAGGAVG